MKFRSAFPKLTYIKNLQSKAKFQTCLIFIFYTCTHTHKQLTNYKMNVNCYPHLTLPRWEKNFPDLNNSFYFFFFNLINKFKKSKCSNIFH